MSAASNNGDGSSITGTNQLLMQTLLALQGQISQNQQTRSTEQAPPVPRTASASGHPDALGLQQWTRAPMEHVSLASQPDTRGHYAVARSTHSVATQPTYHIPEAEHQARPQQQMSMQQLGSHFLHQHQHQQHQHQQQHQQLYLPHTAQQFVHQQCTHTQQEASYAPYISYMSSVGFPGLGEGVGANGAVDGMQCAGSGSWLQRVQGASGMPGPGHAADGLECQEPPSKRARGAMPSDRDWTGALDPGGASRDAAASTWSREEDYVKAAAYVPRMEPVWSAAVCPVSADALKNMRKRAQAIAQGKSLPSETSMGPRAKAAGAVKRSKAAMETVTNDDRDSALSASMCPASETDKTESTILCQGSDTGSNSVPERSSGCSGVSESTGSGNGSGTDNGNGHGNGSESYGADSRSDTRSNGSESNATSGNGRKGRTHRSESSGEDSSVRDSRSNVSESVSADSSSHCSRSHASESNGGDSSGRDSRSNVSESVSADSGGDSRSNASESNGGDSGAGDSHDMVSDSNGGEGGSNQESSSNDGVQDGDNSSGTREGSSERFSDAGSEHETSSNEL